jgi:hypothetical protein
MRYGSPEWRTCPLCSIEHHRLDADQRSLSDAAAVQHHHVADRDFRFEDQRDTGIRMQDRAVLDVRPRADDDRLVVAADDAIEPHRRLVLQDDTAEHGRVVGNEMIATAQFDAGIAERVEHRRIPRVWAGRGRERLGSDRGTTRGDHRGT